ncbi:MAG: hypothetical protein KAS86_01625 [Candidatus Omnitrophica bacterium]|nr:hypothetical protein [Candidatus Omnitrophota bacterium]
MNEKDFWRFLEKAWEKGRAPSVSGSIDSPDPEIRAAGEYIGGHSFLPADYQDISEEIIQNIGRLLLRAEVGLKTKEAIMVLLAHQTSKTALNVLKEYNRDPDEDLRYFAKLALDECKCWN